MTSKTIVAISGSLRADSSNTRILKLLRSWVPDEINYVIYDELNKLPHFSPLTDDEIAPAEVDRLHQLLNAASAVIICTPEYAFGVPGSLKNLLDWTVTSGNFVNKPTALVTASSKGDDAHANLLKTLGALSAHIIDDGVLLIPFIRSKFNASGELTDETTEQRLKNLLDAVLHSLTNAGNI